MAAAGEAVANLDAHGCLIVVGVWIGGLALGAGGVRNGCRGAEGFHGGADLKAEAAAVC